MLSIVAFSGISSPENSDTDRPIDVAPKTPSRSNGIEYMYTFTYMIKLKFLQFVTHFIITCINSSYTSISKWQKYSQFSGDSVRPSTDGIICTSQNFNKSLEFKDTTQTPKRSAFETESDSAYTSTPIAASERGNQYINYSLFNIYANDNGSVSSNLPTTPLSRNKSSFWYTKS